MLEQFIQGRTYVFIDASNVYHAFKNLDWKIDFIRLRTYLQRCAQLENVFYYTAYDPEHFKQRKFLDFLDSNGFIVRKKKVKFIQDGHYDTGGFHKGNLDVELVIDAVHHRDHYDSFILFSGDSDFEALIKYLRKHGKKCVVISSKGQIAIELIQQAKFVNIKKLRAELEMK